MSSQCQLTAVVMTGVLLLSGSVNGQHLSQVQGPSQVEKTRLDSMFTISYSPTGSWTVNSRRTYEYNQAGQMSLSTLDYYDEETQDWTGHRRTESEWDEQGRLIKNNIFKKRSEFMDLILDQYEQLYYDDQGRLTQVLAFARDGVGWIRTDRDDFAYHENGVIKRVTDFYRVGESEWMPNYFMEYDLDNLGNIGQMTFYNIIDGAPNAEGRTIYHYNDQGDMIECNHYLYTNGDFLLASQQSYTHDTLVPRTSLIIPHLYPFEEYLLNHKLTQVDSLEYVASSQVFSLKSRDILYYSGGSSGTNPVRSEPIIRVFPNPVGDHLFLEGSADLWPAEFSIYNQAGQVLIKMRINSSGSVSLSNIPPGFYFYHIQSRDNHHYGRLIKN